MQIVIDIDENLYTRLFDNGGEYVTDVRKVCVAIRKGTPLPKGHGRLIDESYLLNILRCEEYESCAWKNCSDCNKEKGILKEKDLDRIVIIPKEQEPCEDCISRQSVTDTTICDGISCNERSFNTCEDGQSGCLLKERVDKLPPVTPQHTDAEIQKMQELEQAEIEKAYELGKADVLDKIRADVINIADGRRSMSVRSVINILDKYKAESGVEE